MKIGTTKTRNPLSDILDRVARDGDRVVLHRHGKGVAAMVSMEDLALLERAEDEYWATEARKAQAEAKRKGEKYIPLEQVERELHEDESRRNRKKAG